MVKVIELNDEIFNSEVINSATPVLVDFYATWCDYCKKQLTVLDELAKVFDGKVKIAKINIDENKTKTLEYGVCSVPGIFIFNNGNIVKQLIGFYSQSQLSEILNKYL